MMRVGIAADHGRLPIRCPARSVGREAFKFGRCLFPWCCWAYAGPCLRMWHNEPTGKAKEAKITKVDVKKDTVMVKMQSEGKEVEKTFKLAENIEYIGQYGQGGSRRHLHFG